MVSLRKFFRWESPLNEWVNARCIKLFRDKEEKPFLSEQRPSALFGRHSVLTAFLEMSRFRSMRVVFREEGMWDPIRLTRMLCFCLWILSTVHDNSCFGVGGWGGLFNVLNCFQVLQSPSVSTFKGQTRPHWNTSQPVTEVLTFLDKPFEPLTWWKQNPWPAWVLGFWKSPRAYHFPWLLVWSWLSNGDNQSSDGVEVRWDGTP